MSHSRSPSISVYDYPEHLNPFQDENPTNHYKYPETSQIPCENKSVEKDVKEKFWTFGKSRRKKSKSFSIKSTWKELFGKHKNSSSDPHEGNTSVITTVSTTYRRNPNSLRDEQEFNAAFSTLTRKKKTNWDNPFRCSSISKINGDLSRIYDGTPQDTTSSIMGDLTPKPPARRFGHVNPRPMDKIPPLNYEEDSKERKENGFEDDDDDDENSIQRTPIPPLRRHGLRSSQRLNNLDPDTLRDENENLADDYLFKRCSEDIVRRSNISINSCVSVTSTASAYGRKKRRAPNPPVKKEPLETPQEEGSMGPSEESKLITQVTETIDELTKKSQQEEEEEIRKTDSIQSNIITDEILILDSNKDTKDSQDFDVDSKTSINISTEESIDEKPSQDESKEEIIENHSRRNSFSVESEIEKLEEHIKTLEAQPGLEQVNNNDTRLSLEANRRHFFRNLIPNEHLNIESKELPSEEKDIGYVILDNPESNESVKVIELHITEPIRRKPELLEDVNPIPKPRRHYSFNVNPVVELSREDRFESLETRDKRGKSF